MKKIREYIMGTDVQMFLANTPQLTFETTDACNLNCFYCGYGTLYNEYNDRTCNYLSPETAINFLNYIANLWQTNANRSTHSNIAISFYGGEPLMNFSFIEEVVTFIKRELSGKHREFTFNITTNAVLLDRYMDFMVENEFRILISLDGNKHNNSYRVDHAGKESYERVAKNINLLRNKYPDYFEKHVNFNSVLHNRNSIPVLHDYFKQSFGKYPSIGELNDTNIRQDMKEVFTKTYRNPTESLMQSENYSEIELDMFLKSPTYGSVAQFLINNSEFKYDNYNELLYGKPSIDNKTPTGTCFPFGRKVFITANGKLLPCERIGHQHMLGQITKDSVDIDFEAIAKRYNQYYAKLEKQCKGCFNKYGCTQCLFYLEDIEKDVCKCKGFMNQKTFEDYRNTQLHFLARNPEAYSKIMNDVKYR
ncbi:MAG: radical SAM peptide maturase [Bacteroidales bacterium]|nr:radical SAM peptide maturase [Bacteroidales bacterium]MBN2751063.1 radical SAM peptide maturase [Bacteroidales bacterium]